MQAQEKSLPAQFINITLLCQSNCGSLALLQQEKSIKKTRLR